MFNTDNRTTEPNQANSNLQGQMIMQILESLKNQDKQVNQVPQQQRLGNLDFVKIFTEFSKQIDSISETNDPQQTGKLLEILNRFLQTQRQKLFMAPIMESPMQQQQNFINGCSISSGDQSGSRDQEPQVRFEQLLSRLSDKGKMGVNNFTDGNQTMTGGDRTLGVSAISPDINTIFGHKLDYSQPSARNQQQDSLFKLMLPQMTQQQPQAQMNQNDLLGLLVSRLKNQTPSNPSDFPTQFQQDTGINQKMPMTTQALLGKRDFEEMLRNNKSSLNPEANQLVSNIAKVTKPQRRSNKNLTYQQQINRSLKDALGEQRIKQIKGRLVQDIEKYKITPNLIVIHPSYNERKTTNNFNDSSDTRDKVPGQKKHPLDSHTQNSNTVTFDLDVQSNSNQVKAADDSKDEFRGSRYRGPSKNRNKWQVMKMVEKKTVRVGGITTELEAAKIYDILSILTEGLNAKTNFSYNVGQLEDIIEEYYPKDAPQEADGEPTRQANKLPQQIENVFENDAHFAKHLKTAQRADLDEQKIEGAQ